MPGDLWLADNLPLAIIVEKRKGVISSTSWRLSVAIKQGSVEGFTLIELVVVERLLIDITRISHQRESLYCAIRIRVMDGVLLAVFRGEDEGAAVHGAGKDKLRLTGEREFYSR